MYQNKKFQQAARLTKLKAVFLTIAFHVALFSLFTYGSESDLKDMLPDKVKEWLNKEKPEETKVLKP